MNQKDENKLIELVLKTMLKHGDTLTDKHLKEATGLDKQALKRLLGLGGAL